MAQVLQYVLYLEEGISFQPYSFYDIPQVGLVIRSPCILDAHFSHCNIDLMLCGGILKRCVDFL